MPKSIIEWMIILLVAAGLGYFGWVLYGGDATEPVESPPIVEQPAPDVTPAPETTTPETTPPEEQK